MARLPDWLRLPDAAEMARATSVSRRALRGLMRNRLPQMAAALAFRTLFGLLPISIVAVVIVRMFVSDADLKRLVEQAINFTGIAEVIQAEVEEEVNEANDQQAQADKFYTMLRPLLFGVSEPQGPTPDNVAPIDGEAADADAIRADPGSQELGLTGPVAPGDLDQAIDTVVEKLGQIRFDAIGLIGGLVLIYAALAMIVEVESCFNQICRAQSGRSWVRRITQYWTLMTLGAILIALTFLVGIQVREWVDKMAGDGEAFGRFIVGVAGFLVTVAISTGLITLAYIVLPNRKLRLRPVLAGASVAAVGWEAAKWAFTQYIGFATSSTSTYANLYGSLALIPLFMLWVFLTWIIILFGLQVAYGVQMLEDGVLQEDDGTGPEPLLTGPGVMIDVATTIARKFQQGQSARISDISDALALNSDQAMLMIRTLQRKGFVRQLDEGDGYTLARPAENIRLADLAQAALDHMPVKPGSASEQMASAAVSSLGDDTLASCVEKPAGESEAHEDGSKPQETQENQVPKEAS